MLHPRVPALLVFAWLVLGPTPDFAHAQDAVIQTKPVVQAKPQGQRNYVNLRAGVTAAETSSGRRPNICLEVAPLAQLSVETCGTGNGFLHEDPEPEMAHFRAHWRLSEYEWNDAWLYPRIGGGFAELQVGADKPGFHFTSAPDGIETAGPEVLASVQLVYGLGAGFEMIGEMHLGAAYMAHAPKLALPMAANQPFGGFTLGIGF